METTVFESPTNIKPSPSCRERLEADGLPPYHTSLSPGVYQAGPGIGRVFVAFDIAVFELPSSSSRISNQ
ncbi:hypothetical protein D9615_002736 [Tricholomella constricta]|uniref:Uncharacterized protein n=1 Tax=Tricholomella constricta TaxID=117010 RepID=A0A8H5M6G3_9AGAR|nr:hypothetical protein D9615_002736 [Tricholomella constricta]